MAKLTANEIEIIKRTEARRFWSHVEVGEPHECWNTKYKTKQRSGHVIFGIRGLRKKQIQVYAHRVAWVLTHGAIPEGLFVLHKCGNAKCCNPAHLYLGTLSDNALDSVTHGTNPLLKHSDETVQRIRVMLQEGYSQKYIAEVVGCSREYVSDIKNNKVRAL